MIYLDYNATTPHAPEVADAMRPFLEGGYGNPSSGHALGLQARDAIARARMQIATAINATVTEIAFTSGGTESNNWAVMCAACPKGKGAHVVTCAVEHPSILETCSFISMMGIEVTQVPVDSHGLVDPDDVRRAITPKTAVVSVMHANNEVGTIQPIAEIARIARERDVLMHTDAAQTLGKVAVDVDALGVDLLTIAGHKIYGPKGVGALYIRHGIDFPPLLFGGAQEEGRRPGTENTMGMVGLGAACALLDDVEGHGVHLAELRDRLEAGLANAFDVAINGHPELRLPNTSSIALGGLDAVTLLGRLRGRVAASAGSACHSGAASISPVLAAMGIDEARARATLRLSVGRPTTTDEIDMAIEAIADSRA